MIRQNVYSDNESGGEEEHAPPILSPMFHVHDSGKKISLRSAAQSSTTMSPPPPSPPVSASSNKKRSATAVAAAASASTDKKKQKAESIQSQLTGPLAGLIKIRKWPYSFNQIQRPDGVAFETDEAGNKKRSYRSNKRYSETWVNTQLDRIFATMKDQVYNFMVNVAGHCGQTVEKDFYDESRARSTVRQFGSGAGRGAGGGGSDSASSATLSVSEIISRGTRASETNYSKNDLRVEALQFLGKSRLAVMNGNGDQSKINLEDEQIITGHILINFRVFVTVLAFVVARSDAARQASGAALPLNAPKALISLDELLSKESGIVQKMYDVYAETNDELKRQRILEAANVIVSLVSEYYRLCEAHPDYDPNEPSPTLRQSPAQQAGNGNTRSEAWKRAVGLLPVIGAAVESSELSRSRQQFDAKYKPSGKDVQVLINTAFVEKIVNEGPLEAIDWMVEQIAGDEKKLLEFLSAHDFIQGEGQAGPADEKQSDQKIEEALNAAKQTAAYAFFNAFAKKALLWFEADDKFIAVQLAQLEAKRAQIGQEREYQRQKREWEELRKENTTTYAKWYAIVYGGFPPRSQEESLKKLEELVYRQENGRVIARMPTLDELRAWDLIYNNGKLSEFINEEEHRRLENRPDASDAEWVQLVQNLGMMFMKETFIAALNRAVADVRMNSNQKDIFYMDLMTHTNVRDLFAILTARYVQLNRILNQTRPYPQWLLSYLQENIRALRSILKRVAYDRNKFLYIQGMNTEETNRSRRELENLRQEYMRVTGNVFSDVDIASDAVGLGTTTGAAASGRLLLQHRTAYEEVPEAGGRMVHPPGVDSFEFTALRMGRNGNRDLMNEIPGDPRITVGERRKMQEVNDFMSQVL